MATNIAEEMTKIDEAVDDIASHLKERLHEKAACGRRGWDDVDDCPLDRLVGLLHIKYLDIKSHLKYNEYDGAEKSALDAVAYAMFVYERLRKGNADGH